MEQNQDNANPTEFGLCDNSGTYINVTPLGFGFPMVCKCHNFNTLWDFG